MTALREELRLATRIIRCDAEWDALRDDWDRLYAASPGASTPLDYRWLQRWWRLYRPSLRCPSLQVITVWQGARLVGALPLYSDLERSLPIRRLRFMSTGEAEFEETCPDYLNVLSWPGEEQRCASLMWRAIDQMSWDHLEFVNLADGAPLILEGTRHRHAYRAATCPVADLAGGFDAYLQRLSSSARQRARRLLREGVLAGARFELAAPDNSVEVFNDLTRLHQARWQRASRPGVFVAPRFVEFHRGLIEEWLPAGRAVLARLSLGDRPVAALYGFVTRSRFDFYQSGVDMESAGPLRSPGNLCHLLLMQALAARGIDAYDFLSGAASYKKRLATHETSLFGIQIWRPSLRAVAFRSVRLAGRALKAGFHSRQRSAPDSYTG